MVNSLDDPATVFLDPDDHEEFNLANEGSILKVLVQNWDMMTVLS
jgi:C-terminal processing protease CtpA/Prc